MDDYPLQNPQEAPPPEHGLPSFPRAYNPTYQDPSRTSLSHVSVMLPGTLRALESRVSRSPKGHLMVLNGIVHQSRLTQHDLLRAHAPEQGQTTRTVIPSAKVLNPLEVRVPRTV
jgi:hypothetical protein